MKRIFTFIVFCSLMTSVFAQSPEKMSYQAVIRGNSNQLVTSHATGMKISILQGSATGMAVYVETQTPATNANGLVSLEIGSGTPVTGTFAGINWANGPYFIKTETDPTGGTNYTITGTSQLLSVPYSLHAKTAEGITGGITETDPIFNGSVAKKITVADTAKWTALIHKIGDSYGGGIVFYVDATGQHGLIAATNDQSYGIQWYNGTNRITGTTGDGLYAGAMNTAIIVATQMADNQTGNFAAKVCADYSENVDGVTYGDWYLPSKYELNLLYMQKSVIGGFGIEYYWSSTEYNNLETWFQYFYSGGQLHNVKSTTYHVRAIRTF
jgi:hypothetical protein